MTAEELRSYFNRVYGIEKEWPETYKVDTVTYANCCQFIFNKQPILSPASIFLGFTQSGLMFKGVELIYKP